jgi:hypothetical protein
MTDKMEYEVTLNYTEGSEQKTITTEVTASSEAEAINKAKEKFSIHRDGKNYRVVASASVSIK